MVILVVLAVFLLLLFASLLFELLALLALLLFALFVLSSSVFFFFYIVLFCIVLFHQEDELAPCPLDHIFTDIFESLNCQFSFMFLLSVVVLVSVVSASNMLQILAFDGTLMSSSWQNCVVFATNPLSILQ
jgi:hypothetical protein